MAIKKRTPVEQRALEEAFAHGADEPHERTTAASKPPVPAVAPQPNDAEPQSDKAVSRKLLLRFPDDDMPRLIEKLAAADGRSKHNLTLRALARGLQVLQEENG